MSTAYQTGDQFYEDFGPLKNRVVEIVSMLPDGTYRMKFARVPGAVIPACVLRPYSQSQLDALKRCDQQKG